MDGNRLARAFLTGVGSSLASGARELMSEAMRPTIEKAAQKMASAEGVVWEKLAETDRNVWVGRAGIAAQSLYESLRENISEGVDGAKR